MSPRPILSSNGYPLDTGPDEFGEMRDANDLLGDVDALHERMDSDGYLLLRGLLPEQTVLDARREIMLKFAIIGEIDGVNHPVMDGIRSSQSFVDQVDLYSFTESVRSGMAYTQLVEAPQLLDFFAAFLGGPVRGFDFRWPRFMRPGEATGAHADGPYITRGTRNLWSAWVPLGDTPRIEGGLMVLEGSHRNEKLTDYLTCDADRDKMGWLSTEPPRLRRELGGRWLTTDYRAGDVLAFGTDLIHASLDNNSPEGRCRLSSDTRYLRQGDALDERWNGDDIQNPHGGDRRVFLPGRALDGNNTEFQDEWKPVDERGRLLRRPVPTA